MLVNEFGIVTDVKRVHLQKTPSPMLVTEFGIVTDVKPEQPLKAQPPMLVTESELPLFVTCAGIVIAPEIPGFTATLAVVGDVTV